MNKEKKLFIVIGIFVFVIIVCMGFSIDKERMAIQKDISMIQDINATSEAAFVGVIDDGDVFANVYEGDYKYEDDSYFYMSSPQKDFIEGIYPKSENTIKTNDNKIILRNTTDMISLVCNNMGDIIQGNLVCISEGGDVAIGYTYNIVETINGIETGTKASIIVDGEQCLISAIFLEGNYYRVSMLEPEKFLTEEEAYGMALAYLNANSDSAINLNPGYIDTEQYARIESFKNTTYWHLFFGTKNQRGEANVYDITLDVMSGEILTVNSAGL